MAKLVFLVLAFAVLVALAEVSAHRTTVTTTTIEEDDVVFTTGSREQQQWCRQQIQSQQLNDCRRYLSQGQGSPYGEVLEMTVATRQGQQEQLQQCCQQLRNVDQLCQCEAVQEAFRQAQQEQQQQGGRRQSEQTGSRRGSQQEQQLREMLQKAQNLPRVCRLESQQCQIQAPWF